LEAEQKAWEWLTCMGGRPKIYRGKLSRITQKLRNIKMTKNTEMEFLNGPIRENLSENGKMVTHQIHIFLCKGK